jgi:putative N-acetylmannosamine-6-phosphate epimerase
MSGRRLLMDKDSETLQAEKGQLKEQLKELSNTKDTFLLELTHKTQQNVLNEKEKGQIIEALESEKHKVQELLADLKRQQDICDAQQKRVDLLEATLKDNASQLLIQQQQHKSLHQEVKHCN